MNIQQFEYVIAVGEHHSFGQAAEECFVTQSTLSTMVGRLEDELGVTIFDRKTKPVSVTPDGESIIRQLKRIIKEIQGLKDVVAEMKDEVTGTITIGVIPTIGPYLLPHFLSDFVQKYPKIQFELREITTEKMVSMLESRDLDIGIASIPLGESELIELPLYDEPFYYYDVRNGTSGEKITLSGIDLNRLWLLDEGHCMLNQVEQICNLKDAREISARNFDYKSGTIDSLLKFVRQHGGNTLLPQLATLEFSASDRKRLSPFQAPVPARSIGLLAHRHFVKKGILKQLQQDIQEKITPLLAGPNTEIKIYNPV